MHWQVLAWRNLGGLFVLVPLHRKYSQRYLLSDSRSVPGTPLWPLPKFTKWMDGSTSHQPAQARLDPNHLPARQRVWPFVALYLARSLLPVSCASFFIPGRGLASLNWTMGITSPDQVSIPPHPAQPHITPPPPPLPSPALASARVSLPSRPGLRTRLLWLHQNTRTDQAPEIVVLAKGTTRASAAQSRQWRRHDINPTTSAGNSVLPNLKDVVRRPEACQRHGERLRAPSLTFPTHKKTKIPCVETS